MKTVSILTISHRKDDARLFHKIAVSLSHEYQVSIIHNRDKLMASQSQISLIGLKQKSKMGFLYNAFHFLSDNPPDLLICVEPLSLLVGNLLKLTKNVTFIYDCHEYFALAFQDKLKLPFNLSFYCYRFFEKLLAMKTKGIITVNDHLAHELKSINTNTQVCANYPLNHNQDISCQIKKRDLIYIGGLSSTRGLTLILDLFKDLADSSNQLSLLFIGTFLNKDEELYAKNFLKSHHLDNNITFIDFLTQQELKRYLVESKIGLSVLDPDVKRYQYAIPLKLLEYLSFGLPVICNNFKILQPIVVDRKCGLCINYDKTELKKAIMTLLVNSDLYNEMSENAVKSVKAIYNWEIEEVKLLNFMRKCINES